MIWEEVLGNQLVHIHRSDRVTELLGSHGEFSGSYYVDELLRTIPRGWSHAICEDDGPEDCPDVRQVGPLERNGRPRWLHQHHGCRLENINTSHPRSQTLNLTVLRTCRQVYVEANATLW